MTDPSIEPESGGDSPAGGTDTSKTPGDVGPAAPGERPTPTGESASPEDATPTGGSAPPAEAAPPVEAAPAAPEPGSPPAPGSAPGSEATPDGLAAAAAAGTGAAGTGDAIRRSPLVAALLSTLIPGLGQWWAGERRRAALLAIPFLVLLGLVAAVVVGRALHVVDDEALVGFFLQPGVLTAILVLDGLFLVYRLAAIVDAWLRSRRRWPGRPDRLARATSLALLVVLLGVNVGVHAGVGYLDTSVADLDTAVLPGNSGPDAILPDVTLPPDDEATPSPVAGASGSPGTSTEPSISASPSPLAGPAWMRNGRLNVLLLGVDAGPGRVGVRTDTMILASVDVATGKAAMFGIPRNLVNVPLPAESADAFPACKCFPELLNALYTYAMGHSGQFPGGDNRGYRAVAGAIETLTGVQLDGVAIINLNGFVQLIDAIGGLHIDIPQAVYDSHYPKPDGTGDIQIFIPAGKHLLDGITALEYARSRHASSDYGRMLRQQAVLLALRAQMKPCNVLKNLPDFLRALKGTVTTTFSPDDLPDLLRLATKVNPDKVKGFAFDPPDYPEWLGKADIQRIRTLVRHVFDPAHPAPSPTPTPTGAPGVAPTPTPSPTPEPVPTPTLDPCA